MCRTQKTSAMQSVMLISRTLILVGCHGVLVPFTARAMLMEPMTMCGFDNMQMQSKTYS